MKLKALKNAIKNEHIFGRIDALVYTIEFQKRGLPHCHMLVILKESGKIKTTEDVDQVVCAELPPPIDVNDPQSLFSVITKCMLHNDCKTNFREACRLNSNGDQCGKGYPKPFVHETKISDDDVHPKYRRRRPWVDNGMNFVIIHIFKYVKT